MDLGMGLLALIWSVGAAIVGLPAVLIFDRERGSENDAK